MNVSILKNGLKVYTIVDENKNTCSLNFVVNAGSYNESENERGVAHFTEHMLFKGTVHRNSVEIMGNIEDIGGEINAYTSFDHTNYNCQMPSDEWETGLDVLCDLMWNNLIDEEEFNKEKNVIIEELKMYDDDSYSKVLDNVFTSMNKDYKNRQLVGGTTESVRNISRQQMIDFIDKYYCPKNMFLLAAGNIDHETIVDYVESYCDRFDLKPNDKQILTDGFEIKSIKCDDSILERQISQSHLSWGLFGPKNDYDEFLVVKLITTMLGGKSTSRLFQEIREKRGLSYQVSMYSDIATDTSYMIGYAGLSKDNIEDVKKILFEQFEELKNGNFEENELEVTKKYMIGRLKFQFETVRGQSNFYIENVLLDREDVTEEDIYKAIDSITMADVIKVANKYLNEDNICFAQVIQKEI